MWPSCSRGTVTGVGSLLMPVRLIMLVIFVILVFFSRAAPAHAQQQSVTFTLGHFAVHGEDARISDDVLVENLDLFAFRLARALQSVERSGIRPSRARSASRMASSRSESTWVPHRSGDASGEVLIQI